MKTVMMCMIGAVALIAAGTATGADLALKPTKDARLMGHESEKDQNGGTSTRLRTVGIGRTSAEFVIMDFDRAALKKFLEDNKGKKVSGKLTLNVKQVQGVTDAAVKLEVAALDCSVDWNEGAGQQKQAEKGECCAAAAQFGEKKWATPDGKEVEDFRALVYDVKADKIKTVANSKGVDVGKDDANKTIEIPLDADLITHLGTDANCRGLFLFHRDKTAKIDVNSREQNKKEPQLVVTAE